MVDVRDVELLKSPEEPPRLEPPPPAGPSRLWIVVGILIVAIAAITYFLANRAQRPAPVTTAARTVPPSSRPLGNPSRQSDPQRLSYFHRALLVERHAEEV